MSTNDYIRQSAQKYHWHKYYSVMSPVSIGTYPKNGMMDFINYATSTPSGQKSYSWTTWFAPLRR